MWENQLNYKRPSLILYRNTSPNSRWTVGRLRFGESKNVTPINHPTHISDGSALTDSTPGGYHTLVSGRWYGRTIASIHDLGTIIWAKKYPSVIHLILVVSLTLWSHDYKVRYYGMQPSYGRNKVGLGKFWAGKIFLVDQWHQHIFVMIIIKTYMYV